MKKITLTSHKQEEAVGLFLSSFEPLEVIAQRFGMSRAAFQKKLREEWLDPETYKNRCHERTSHSFSGENNPRHGAKISEEQKDKQRESLKGFKHSPETRAEMSRSHTGKKLSPETIERCKQNAASYWKGKTFTGSHLEKIRAARNTAEHRAKMSTVAHLRLEAGRNNIYATCRKGVYVDRLGRQQRFDSGWEETRMRELDEAGLVWSKHHHVTILYVDQDGVARQYRPDFKITYPDGQVVIEEVKGYETEKDLLKYKAARAYCRERGWGFRVLKKSHFSP